MESWRIIQNQLQFLLLPFAFKILRALITVWHYFYCKARGVNHKPSASQVQGQVLVSRVLLRLSSPYLIPASTGAFITLFEDIYPIEYLENPDISLYSLEGDFVYFVQTSQQTELYNLRKHCFFFMGQISLAEKLIKVHKNDLINFMDSVPDPQAKVVWIYHSGRCGSTALAQAINAIGNWKTISEIGWLFGAIPALNTYDEIKAYMTGNEFSRLAKACIKSQLMRYPAGSKICWKVSPLNEPYLIPLVTREFPDHRIIYMSRRGDLTANSFYRGTGNHFIIGLVKFVINKGSWIFRKTGALHGLIRMGTNGMITPAVLEHWLDGNTCCYQMLYCAWATGVRLVKDIRMEHPYVKLLVIDYAVLMSNLRENVKKIFEYLDIPEADLQAALNSFEEDSQANSAVSRENKRPNKGWQSDAISVEKCTKLSLEFGLPAHGQEFTMQHFNFDNWIYIMKDGAD